MTKNNEPLRGGLIPMAIGVIFRQSIRDDDDGLRGFELTDADGYVLFFGRPKA
jgi:hypothetical protein